MERVGAKLCAERESWHREEERVRWLVRVMGEVCVFKGIYIYN